MLVVEDDPAIRGLLAAALRREPLAVDVAPDGVAALERVREADYAVIITDLMLPRLDGIGFVEEFRRARPAAQPVVFMMTASDDVKLARLNGHVHAIVRKPFDVDRLVATVSECALLFAAIQPAAELGGGARDVAGAC